MLVRSLFLVLWVSNVRGSVDFSFPSGQTEIYIGYSWVGTEDIHIRPLLRAVPKGSTPGSNRLCGIKVSGSHDEAAPFHAEITDETYGIAELRLNRSSEGPNHLDSGSIFYVEAYDCESPPNFSKRVPVRIHVIKSDGPFFIEPTYQFTVSQQSHENSFVGQVQAVARPGKGQENMYSAICNYLIADEESPFSIDKHGVIRISKRLEARPNGKPYMLQVIAEDCHRPVPRRTTVGVIVSQISEGCQTGWKGLPAQLDYHNPIDKPAKLLHPYHLDLEFCVNMCKEPEIRARLELQSAVEGYRLKTASTERCLHDPEHLHKQRTICGLHPTTMTWLLPVPDRDIASQILNPTLNNPPTTIAPERVWRFNASMRTVWQVDPSYLNANDGSNTFDNDFTVTFWVRRFAGVREYHKSEKEEVVLCSQDRNQPNWRYLSIGFSKCRLIVRLLASLKNTPTSVDTDTRKPSVWTFDSLPDEYCVPTQNEHATWHHYAISFSHNPLNPTPDLVSLMIDGNDLGSTGTPMQTRLPGLPPFAPGQNKADPIITVGGCYDPDSRIPMDYLNGDLAGLTVLTERAEAINNLRCVAHCGESLIVPNIRKYLKSDVSVDLTSDSITVLAQNVTHVADILRAVAYVRPEPGLSPGYTPNAVQARLLNLTTTYSCTTSIDLPASIIQLNVFPEYPDSRHSTAVGSIPSDTRSNTQWVPKQEFGRPEIAQADIERKAWLASKSGHNTEAPPSLIIDGSNIVITEPPIRKPGIHILPDVRFLFSDSDDNEAAIIAASSVPLDGCSVWIDSSKVTLPGSHAENLAIEDQGHIEWPIAPVREYGLYGADEKHGVEFRGEKPAGDYAKLLRKLHYWPPKVILDQGSEEHSSLKFVAKIGVMCTLESGRKITSKHFVNVVFESSEEAQGDLANDDALRNLSPEEDDDENSAAQFLASWQVDSTRKPRLSPRDLSYEVLSPQSHPSMNNKRLAIGLSVTTVLILVFVCVTVGIYVSRRSRPPAPSRPGRRRRFPAQPADFGGSNLKFDPTLRLTANPIGEVEYQGIGVVSEDLYGSSRHIAPPRENIFSPPVPPMQQNLWANARLAGLEEFDEYGMEGPSEDFYEDDSNDVSGSTGQLSNHHSDQHEADVHEWIDDEDPLQVDQPVRQSDTKCELVAMCDPDEFGSPVVTL